MQYPAFLPCPHTLMVMLRMVTTLLGGIGPLLQLPTNRSVDNPYMLSLLGYTAFSSGCRPRGKTSGCGSENDLVTHECPNFLIGQTDNDDDRFLPPMINEEYLSVFYLRGSHVFHKDSSLQSKRNVPIC